ncbi:hypothetical protein [Wolbachia endosymbiont (group E) of Neria commutata]|uniref:hypothetical protein n=1 Tax=Wolbachia endosymbiont (group E) of Neria commutata TaxID=3066149 RepID=UPI0031329DED
MSELKNVRAILEAGGDVDVRDYKGYRPMDVAYMGKFEEIVEELIEYEDSNELAYKDSTELVELSSRQYKF